MYVPKVLVQRFWRNLLEMTLEDNDLIDRPAHIFNMDETGVPLDPKAPFIVAGRGQRHPSYLSGGSKSQITVLSCCNAAGYTIPPFVIFDRKALKPELTLGEVPGTMYGLSSSGWVDSELFHLWFENHFLTYPPSAWPLLLIMDGHSSHYNPNTIHMAAERGVVIFCLPPNTTHKTQPLDKGCFSPLKAHWKVECNAYLKSHPGKVVTHFQFSELFKRAWVKGMTMTNVIQGFKVTGIYPFNPHALIPKPTVSPVSRFHNLGADSGLKFIPLFSPAPDRYRKSTSVIANHRSTDLSLIEEDSEAYLVPEEIDFSTRRFEEKESSAILLQSAEFENTLSKKTHLFTRLLQEPPSMVSQDSVVKPITKTGSARVLTSRENIRALDEKRKKKADEFAEKERKKKTGKKRKQ